MKQNNIPKFTKNKIFELFLFLIGICHKIRRDFLTICHPFKVMFKIKQITEKGRLFATLLWRT